ncbi:Aldehyde oxidase 4 [Microtus ochrogaster]|uniref:xanthine dehydrogenase n=1 Tax=Microtus ochrogaster TaxID=79684 RepID=A0A8J6GIX8_MICOH|nr:Aldehyde oxidase 4 [Microtus ochrogaster]
MPSVSDSDELIFFVNGRKVVEKSPDPEVNLLFYLRKVHILCRHYPVTACLVPICSLHGAAITTVEGVGSIRKRIHPVQERLAKCHGTQCGFCSPGMVMSIYTLLRNHPEPTPDQITEALGGNLCRCTGYRPIVESVKTFSPICTKLYDKDEFQPLDPSQEPIFPPELIRMAEDPDKRRLTFRGPRTTWFVPVTLEDLLELKASYPKAPLVMGNTAVGPSIKFKGEFYPVFISPLRFPELHLVKNTENGGHVVSRPNFSDLNPILAAGNATINVMSKEGEQQIPLDGAFFEGSPETNLKPEWVVVSVSIPYTTQWHFVAGLRLAQRQENAVAIVNAGMSVEFEEGTNTIKDLQMFFGSVAPKVVSASQTCKQLIGRQWDDQMLSDACRWVLEEIRIPAAAQGGMVEYRRTLIVSLLFKFYLKVRRWLNKMCVDPNQPQQDPVGRPVMHQSAIKHATGEAIFIDDMPPLDQELFLAVVTSTRAHAKITSLDASEALACPGVVDVITAEDVPGENNHSGEIFYAQDEVICVGQIVCAVAADTYAHAKEAAKRVRIAYDDVEPVIITIEQALEHNSFLSSEKKIEQGNVEYAFEHVDQVIEGEIHVEGQEHFYMETQSILAIPQAEDKEMVLHLGTQFPTHVQEYVSAALKVPRSRIACHMKRAGGAFGGKVTKPALLGAVTAVAANKTGRPIRFILERSADMLITAGRHPLLGKYKERIAKSQGTQCGFCTPGMVMSMYALLRNHPQPSEEQLMEALGGNLCRCTGYRPILDSGRTFCTEPNGCQQKGTGKCCLDQKEDDSLGAKSNVKTQPSQDLMWSRVTAVRYPVICLQRMAENPEKQTLTFYGERITWISPGTLQDLLALKAKYPEAPVVSGSTSLGPAMKSQGHFYPILLSPARVPDLRTVTKSSDGLTIGACCSLAQLKDILAESISELPEEKTQTYQALLKHLRSLAGQQIRNMATLGGHVISRHCYSDLNPILSVGKATLNLLSEETPRGNPALYPDVSDIPERLLSPQWEFVSAFRQAQCPHNALPDLNAGMRVLFSEGTGTIEDLSIAFGGVGPATVSAHRSCQQLLGRHWNALLLDEACRHLLEEIWIPGSALGGKVEFKRTLMVSFLFKFYLEVLQGLRRKVKLSSESADSQGYPAIADRFLSALEDFQVALPQGVQTYQDAIKHNSFLCPEKKLEQGNIEEAFENVDQIVEGEVHVGGQEHFYMETQRALVIPKTEDQELDVYVSTQDPAHVQKTVSSTLNIPSNKITCHVKRVGGGFGGKVGRPAVFGAIAAVGAAGFMNSGRIKALDIECYINGGCTLDDSELVTEFLVLKLENAYKIRNLRLRGRACMTNLPSNTAFRGFGFPQGTLVTESCITAVAAKCGLPPEKIREKNMYKTIDKTIYKQAFSPEPLIRCWNECLDKSSFHARRTQVEEFNRKNYWKKRGIAIIPMKFSVGFAATSYHQAAALVHIYTDGSVLVAHGGNELGQGIHTKMLQVASRELKVPMSYMYICETSTAFVPNTIATAASVGADVNGRAVQNACQILLKRLEPIVKKNPDGTWRDWIEGAFIQGMGLYTTEELHYSPEGVLYSRSPEEYKIPSVTDVPQQFNVSLLPSSETPLTIYSSKGLGESGMFLGSSVFFAIADAVAAARRERDLAEDFTVQSPATPERVRMACADRFTDMVGWRSVPTSSVLLPEPLASCVNRDVACV